MLNVKQEEKQQHEQDEYQYPKTTLS